MDVMHDSGMDPRDEAQPLRRGDMVGRYVILQQLGVGGMGMVYAAYDPELDRRVALKILHPSIGRDSAVEDRLVREARSLARLNHPNVVTVHDVGHFGGDVFMAMEHVDGQTLREWLREDEQDHREVLRRFVLAGRGLEAAHLAGIVHRDFKPDNVMVDRTGFIRVMDFGLARATDDPADEAEISLDDQTPSPSGGMTERLTQTGARIGTPAYMAPEQHAMLDADARTDQFSFCVALYESLYGVHPYAGRTSRAIKGNIAEGKLRAPPAGTEVPAWVFKVIERGLSLDRDDRYPSMGALLADLERDPTAGRGRTGRLMAAVVVGAMAAGGLAYASSAEPEQCTDSARHLDGVWDADTREQLEAAFADTGLSYSSTAAESVIKVLDDYAAGWVDMRTEACRATRVHGEQSEALLDARMSCLDERLGELDALARVFKAPDAKVVERSVETATHLDSVDDCGSSSTLLNRDPLAGLDADAIALRTRIVQARAAADAGENDDARAELEIALAEARKRGEPLLIAEALFGLGLVHSNRGDGKAAREALLEAGHLADEVEDDELRVAVFTGLAWAVGQHLGDYDEADVYTRVARGALERVGGDDSDLSAILNHEATFMLHRGRYEEGEARYEEALAVRERVGLVVDPMYADMLNNLGSVYFATARYDEALEAYQRALELQENSIGREHPSVGEVFAHLGNVYQVQGRYDEALDYLERAIALRQKTESEKSPALAISINNLAVLQQEMGRHDEAAATYERAMAIWEEVAPDHPNLAVAQSNLAELEILRGNPAQGLEHAQGALARFERLVGAEHQYCAYALSNAGRARVRLGQPVEAIPELERALAIFDAEPSDPVARAEAEFALASALVGAQGDHQRATELAQAALGRFDEAGPRGEPRTKAVQRWLAANG